MPIDWAAWSWRIIGSYVLGLFSNRIARAIYLPKLEKKVRIVLRENYPRMNLNFLLRPPEVVAYYSIQNDSILNIWLEVVKLDLTVGPGHIILLDVPMLKIPKGGTIEQFIRDTLHDDHRWMVGQVPEIKGTIKLAFSSHIGRFHKVESYNATRGQVSVTI